MCVYNPNIIAFAGRMNSGKTVLANICEEFGYKRLYFALPLKQLCAKLLDITVDEMNTLKRNETKINFEVNSEACELISNETLIPLSVVKEKCLRKPLNDVREVLQFIGTDLIREYDPDWHVKRVIQMIKPDEKYVIDDVRFRNEYKALMKLGVVTWFIVRPDIKQISNHVSETQLKWQDFHNKVILNNGSLEYFLLRWRLFMKDYEKNVDFRDNIISFIERTGRRNLGSDIIMTPVDYFNYNEEDFSNVKKEDVTQDENGIIRIKDKIILNPLNIEDLKFNF